MANPIWANIKRALMPKPKKAPEYTFASFQGKVDKVTEGERSKLAERAAKLDGLIAEAKAKLKVLEDEAASIKPWLSVQ